MDQPDQIDRLIRPLATDLMQAAHLIEDRLREVTVLSLLRGAVRAIISSTIEETKRALAVPARDSADPRHEVAAALEPILESVQRERHRDPLAQALLRTVVMNGGRLTGPMVARYLDDVCSARAALAKNFRDYIVVNGTPTVVMTRIPVNETEVAQAWARFCDARLHVTGEHPDAEAHAFRSAIVSLMQETSTMPASAGQVRQ